MLFLLSGALAMTPARTATALRGRVTCMSITPKTPLGHRIADAGLEVHAVSQGHICVINLTHIRLSSFH